MNEEPMKLPEEPTEEPMEKETAEPTAEPESKGSGEPSPEKTEAAPRQPISFALFDYVEMFAWAVFAVLIVFTFAFRICRVDGRSMENTLHENQMLMLRSAFYTPKQDDIVVFHLTDPDHNMEKTLVKRVIATGGQEVVINTKTNVITVDGVVYADSHAVLKDRSTNAITGKYDTIGLFFGNYDSVTGIYRATVPEGYVFVMGDNRNNSKDSRNPDVGFVDERCILGGVFLRFAPFTVFH